MTNLFDVFDLRGQQLRNRTVIPPMTRARASASSICSSRSTAALHLTGAAPVPLFAGKKARMEKALSLVSKYRTEILKPSV